MVNNIFNVPSIDVDCQAESHRLLNLYSRYMNKKFRFSKYEHSIFKTCPNYENYYSHINGLLIKKKKNLHSKIFYLNYPPTSCKELDLIVKRFLFKKYKLNLYYNRNIKLKKNIGYKNFRIRFLKTLQNILFDLRPKGSNFIKKVELKKKNNCQSEVLILSHDLYNTFEAYKNLPKKLSIFLRKENLDTEIITPNNIGLSIYEKIKNSNKILKKFSQFNFISLLKLSDLHFIFFESYNEIYKNKLKKYFAKKKIKYIVCSYIDSRYEPLYFIAAKELNIKYFNYDYSLGYPFRQTSYLRYLPDTRKFCDIIFANSEFRKEQYKLATNFLKKPPAILPNICPQSDYSKNIKRFNVVNSQLFNIGIVDNVFSADYSLNCDDVNSVLQLITNSDLNINLILQSKRGYLEKELNKLNFKNFHSGGRGDFSKLINSDLILSIGWQSIALKSASIYKKPLFFYNKNGFPYENNNFSLDRSKNLRIKKICKKLWFNEQNLIFALNKIINCKNELIYFRNDSSLLLKDIDFYENKIEHYFNKYFKE